MLPGFTAFVSAKKMKSSLSYHTSGNNKYLFDDASSARALPMLRFTDCTWEADVAISWNRPPPPDEWCKWRQVGDRNYCECLGTHWKYEGQKTQLQCAGFGITPDASPIKAQCWTRGWVNCSGSACSGPNPHPRSCPPGQCLVDGQCVNNGLDKACGPYCLDCTVYPGCGGACVSDFHGSHRCFCP
jgi:hypothetical protein